MEKAETFDRNWLMDPQKLCGEKDASFRGGIGPFGLLVLASRDREELTAVFFRVFKDESRYRVLMCSDQRRYGQVVENMILFLFTRTRNKIKSQSQIQRRHNTRKIIMVRSMTFILLQSLSLVL